MVKIIGLEYICLLSNTKYVEIAEMLGISKQTVNSWVSGRRKIPEKHLETLSEKFNKVPIEYFQKELTVEETDEVEIKVISKLANEINSNSEARKEYERLINLVEKVNSFRLVANSSILLDIEDIFDIKEKLNEILNLPEEEEKQPIVNSILSLFYIIIEKKINISVLNEILDSIYWNKELKQDKMNVPDNWEGVHFGTELINLIKCRYKQIEAELEEQEEYYRTI